MNSGRYEISFRCNAGPALRSIRKLRRAFFWMRIRLFLISEWGRIRTVLLVLED